MEEKVKEVFGVEAKAIAEFPGYAVTVEGRVFSAKVSSSNPTPGVLEKSVRADRSGRKWVSFSLDESKQTICALARVLGLAFLERKDGDNLVRHLNDVSSDDRLENLEWGNDYDNSQDSKRNRKLPTGERHDSAGLTNAQAVEMFVAFWEEGVSRAELQRRYKQSRTVVHGVCTGQHYKEALVDAGLLKAGEKRVRPDKKGKNNGRSKLTDADVVEIRKLDNEGMGKEEIARRKGVSGVLVGMIVRRKIWTHVD